MTTYYVGSGGSDVAAGTTWATRFLTLAKAATSVAAAGDIVYVGPGTYREQLTVSVSGGGAYSTGTVTATNGNAVVTGAGGAAWATAAVATGDYFKVAGAGAIRIASVDSETQITLDYAFDGATVAGATYMIFRPIHWIGDYSGANTDGVGGVVRITGSADDIAITRTNCIVATSINYIRVIGFALDLATNGINLTTCQYWIVDEVHCQAVAMGVLSSGATQLGLTVQNAHLLSTGTNGNCVSFTHAATVSNAGHVVQNISVPGTGVNLGTSPCCVATTRVGGILVRNSTFTGSQYLGVGILVALAAGQTVTVNNCIFCNIPAALYATAVGEIVEDYNTIYGSGTARTNTNIGANSIAYPPLFDTRWFFEAVK